MQSIIPFLTRIDSASWLRYKEFNSEEASLFINAFALPLLRIRLAVYEDLGDVCFSNQDKLKFEPDSVYLHLAPFPDCAGAGSSKGRVRIKLYSHVSIEGCVSFVSFGYASCFRGTNRCSWAAVLAWFFFLL